MRANVATVLFAGSFVAFQFTTVLHLQDLRGWTALEAGVALLGLAFTLVHGPLTIIALEGVADAEQSLAGGIRNTSSQLGAALGLASAASLTVAAGEEGPLAAFHDALLVPVVATAAAVLVVATGLRPARTSARVTAG
ncbi:hypothetical protein [Saccharothrix yanglingensis]|uniref:hypothetical protein n=1 Tax=Saccharothrix yanglingensis TaxID=659496 RepID=UPI0027D2434F|nr:hypothetical protein [Saccharothrix yanglingensis]